MMMPNWFETLMGQAPEGLMITAIIAAGSILGSFGVGVPLGAAASWSAGVARLARVYAEAWRAIPVVVTVFGAFFLLPAAGILLDPILTVIVGLTLWGSANIAEIVRGAVQSIPREQGEAATALGLSSVTVMVFVILPQAFRRMLPSAVGIVTILIQATALATVVGVQDFLNSATATVDLLTFEEGNSHAFEVYATVMAVYFAICFPLTQLSRHLERRLAT